MIPEMMHDPPDIDPREHAIESRHWGACSCHLVRYEGRYYAWMAAAAGPPVVYPMAGEAAARSFLDGWQAATVLHTPWDEMVVHVFLLDPGRAAASGGGTGGKARIVYHSAVIDAGGDGIWVASYQDTEDDDEAGGTGRDALCTSVRTGSPGLGCAMRRSARSTWSMPGCRWPRKRWGRASRPCTAGHTTASPACMRSCAGVSGWTGRSTTIRGTPNATSPSSPTARS